jgi:hypothetical protein
MSEIKFVPVDPDSVREHWPLVKTGLMAMYAKADEDFWPEDVYVELREGRFTLILSVVGGVTSGFMVVKIAKDIVGKYLFVWLLYAPGQADLSGYWVEYLKSTANRHACYKIEGGSLRKGWSRLLEHHGFKPSTVWSLALTGEPA